MNNNSSARFEGQTALVTGGGGDIGKAIALRLAKEGAKIALLDVSETQLQAARSQFAAEGLSCETIVCDVGDESSVNQAAATAIEKFGSLQIAVHCAGITGPTGKRICDISVEDFDRVYAINLRSAFLIAKATLPHMEKNGYGRVVMLASMAGKDGNPGMAPYTTSKAGVIGLVKGLGKEYAQCGITVNAIAPAVIRTAMNQKTSDAQLKYMIEKIPMGRFGEVDEAASLCAWICSREASFTTGFIHDLSGGRATY